MKVVLASKPRSKSSYDTIELKKKRNPRDIMLLTKKHKNVQDVILGVFENTGLVSPINMSIQALLTGKLLVVLIKKLNKGQVVLTFR